MDRRQAKQLVIEKGMKHILCSNQGHYRLWWWRTHCQGNRGQSHLSWSLSWSCIVHKQQNKEERAINIANLRLLQKGKAPLKSVSTAFNRSGPRSLRALQAKRHIGKGLFCLKKPPKVEDCSNENTHYIPKRGHVNNINMSFFSPKKPGESKLCYTRSVDDKAYTRPIWKFSLQRTFNIKKDSRYEWSEKLVYITPGSHRIFTKEGIEEEDGKETLSTAEDRHFLFGKAWSNEDESGLESKLSLSFDRQLSSTLMHSNQLWASSNFDETQCEVWLVWPVIRVARES